jgi:hypothetical protein
MVRDQDVAVGIRQGHSMFTRALVVPVVYGTKDCSVSDLVADLQATCASFDWGFHAGYYQTRTVGAVPRLRESVPAAARPADFVAGTDYPFSEVFRPEELGDLFDDIGHFLNSVGVTKTDKTAGYVVISSDRDALLDLGPASRCIIGTGFFDRPTHGLAEWVANLGVIKQGDVAPEQDTGAVYVHVDAIHMELRALSFIPDSGIQYVESAFDSLEEWDRVNNALHLLQPIIPGDVGQIAAIACYVSHLSDEEMLAQLRRARKQAAKKRGIKLEGQDEGNEEDPRREEEQQEEEDEGTEAEEKEEELA